MVQRADRRTDHAPEARETANVWARKARFAAGEIDRGPIAKASAKVRQSQFSVKTSAPKGSDLGDIQQPGLSGLFPAPGGLVAGGAQVRRAARGHTGYTRNRVGPVRGVDNGAREHGSTTRWMHQRVQVGACSYCR